MRRIVRIFAAMLVCMLLCLNVQAASDASITRLQSSSTVSTDGSCLVTVMATLHLNSPVSDLTFPLPSEAQDITLNGSHIASRRAGGYRLVSLSSMGAYSGDYSFSLQYRLPDILTNGKNGNLDLSLPLLSAFPYPIDSMEFSVTLPGEIPQRPTFISGYRQNSIESDMELSYLGATLNGAIRTQLKDHETLEMQLTLPAEMFPGTVREEKTPTWPYIAMVLCMVLACAYYFLTMRSLPSLFGRRTTPPDGLTAGEMGSCLTGTGPNLTDMVLTWASLGYILIQLDDNGRVLLHKRMDMGNERTGFETRVFHKLFGNRKLVDGSGYHYAQLCRRVAAQHPRTRGMFRRGSGNPTLLRFICTAAAFFSGAAMGITCTANPALRVIAAILFGIICSGCAWVILLGCRNVQLRDRLPLLIGLAAAILWLILGMITGQLPSAAGCLVFEIAAGLACAYGGMRTDSGRTAAAQILHLRHYLRTVKPEELVRICRSNPDYFFELAPYALALGVDKTFAARFRRMHMPACDYLTTGVDTRRTAAEWAQLLREAADTLDLRQKRLPLDRLFGKL